MPRTLASDLRPLRPPRPPRDADRAAPASAAKDPARDAVARAAHRRWLAATVGNGRRGAMAAAGLLDPLGAIALAGAVALGVTHVAGGWHGLTAALMLGGVAAGLRGASSVALARLGADAARSAKTGLRRRVLSRLLAGEKLTSRRHGDPAAVLTGGVEALDGHVSRFLPAQRVAGPAQLLILAATACASPVVAGIELATLLPFIGVMILAGGAAADEAQRQFGAMARLSGLFADRITHLKLLLVYGAVADEAARMGRSADAWRRRTMGVLRVAFVSSAGLEFFAALSVAMVAVYCGFSLLHLLPFAAPERLDLGRALFALALAPEFYAPMRRLAAAYHDRQQAETAAAWMDLVPPRDAPADDRLAAPRLSRPPHLRFVGVGVCHPGEARPALRGLDLELPAGGSLALLGPSGSGKSTALGLLIGVPAWHDGAIEIDGRPLAPGASLANSVGWVGQEPLLVEGSLRDNLALAAPAAREADILRTAFAVGLHDVLSRPGGLGQAIDGRGSGLSGGERRRIGLARALLRAAPLLLLDEPTAHLDADAAASLRGLLAEVIATGAHSVLIATHDPDLAALAGGIVRLGDGAKDDA